MALEDHPPEYEPGEIAIGETLEWRKSFADYKAGDGWALTYYFRGAGPGFDKAAAADGDDFRVTVPAATTAQLAPGKYYFEARASDGSVEHVVARGEATAVVSLKGMATTATLDGRSSAQRILDAIDAVIEGRATSDQQSYKIGQRELSRIPLADLIAARTRYAQIVSRERRAARRREGAPFLKNVLVRFDRPQ